MSGSGGLDSASRLMIALTRPWATEEELREAWAHVQAGGEAVANTLCARTLGNECGPMLYRNLARIGARPPFMERLRMAYLQAVAHNARHLAWMDEALRAIEARGCEAMALKGAVASELLFDDPGAYTGADLDILVRERDLQAAREALLALGYEPDGADLEDLRRTHYHWRLQRRGSAYLELHWTLLKPRAFEIPAGYWWEGARQERIGGVTALQPEPGRHLLYLILRLYNRGFMNLKFFLLPAALINRYGREIGWGALGEAARGVGMDRLYAVALHMLADTFGARLPGGALPGQPRGYEALRGRLMRGAFDWNGVTPGSRKVMMLREFHAPGRRLAFALRRLAPSPPELRLRYGLAPGSLRVPLYYLLNPILFPVMLLAGRRPGAGRHGGAGTSEG